MVRARTTIPIGVIINREEQSEVDILCILDFMTGKESSTR